MLGEAAGAEVIAQRAEAEGVGRVEELGIVDLGREAQVAGLPQMLERGRHNTAITRLLVKRCWRGLFVARLVLPFTVLACARAKRYNDALALTIAGETRITMAAWVKRIQAPREAIIHAISFGPDNLFVVGDAAVAGGRGYLTLLLE